MTPLLLLLVACGPPGTPPYADEDPWKGGDPAIQGVSLACDPADARWSLRVRTDAWAAGAFLWVTRDGSVVEKHTASSVSAAADGSEDCLSASLGVAADPADATPSGSSRWLCEDAGALSFVLAVSDSRDTKFTDCRVWGAEPNVWAGVSGVPACGIALDDGVDTGAVLGDEGDLGSCFE